MPGDAHRDAVGNRNGVEHHALATGGVDTGGGGARQFIDVHVAGSEVGPGGGDAHLGLAEVRILEAHGAQHGARRGGLEAIDHEAGMRTRRRCGELPSRFFDTVFDIGAFGRFKRILLL